MASKDNTFFLEIVSPEGIVFEGDVEKITLQTNVGEITVLPHHVSLFTKLAEGEVTIHADGKKTHIAVSGGFLEVKENKATILSDYAIRAESIEIAKAEERKRKAENVLQEKAENTDFILAQKDLRKSILELKVAQNVKRRHTNS